MKSLPCPIEPASLPPLPPLSRLALLLDLDGTLLDLASAPTEVRVPHGLPTLLCRLAARLGGALAVISGRPIEEVETLLPGLRIAIAGEHGAAIRRAPGLPLEHPSLPEVPLRWREAARTLAAAHPGVLLEDKPHGFVLHFRHAEAAGPALVAALEEFIAGSRAGFVLVPAILAWEVRPAAADKGTAVRALLERPPYAGRIPLFVGDDVTDDDGIRAARELDGFGFQVAPTFGNAAGVRRWLLSLAEADDHGSAAAPCGGS